MIAPCSPSSPSLCGYPTPFFLLPSCSSSSTRPTGQLLNVGQGPTPRLHGHVRERGRVSPALPPFLGLRKKSQSRSISRLINASLAREIDGNLDSRLEGGNGMAAVSGASTRMTVHGHSRWHCWHGTSGHKSVQGEGKTRYSRRFCGEAWLHLGDSEMDLKLGGDKSGLPTWRPTLLVPGSFPALQDPPFSTSVPPPTL